MIGPKNRYDAEEASRAGREFLADVVIFIVLSLALIGAFWLTLITYVK